MAKVPTIGSIGDRVEMVIRRGATIGPHRIMFPNPDGTPMDLTGASLEASLRKSITDPAPLMLFVCLVDFPIITDPATESQAQFGATAAVSAFLDLGADGIGVWKIDLHDAAGRIIPVFQGPVLLHL